MLEKQYQPLFNRWCQHHFKGSAVFELKRGESSIPFDAVKDHQEHALLQAKHGKLIFKIPDAGFQNPFDSFQLQEVGAYVVLFFEEHYRSTKEFFMIDIDVWLNEKRTSERKSIGVKKASELGFARKIGDKKHPKRM